MLDYKKLALQHIETALSEGYIVLASGEVKNLTATQILNLAKDIVKDALSITPTASKPSETVPMEFFYADN